MLERARANFAQLKTNFYPGRAIIIGANQEGTHFIQVAWIMGRSDPSRNRVYEKVGDRVQTAVADPSKPSSDPALTIYIAMRDNGEDVAVVSNGHQTNPVLDALNADDPMVETLSGWDYEPDPSHTPRITGYCADKSGHPTAMLSLIRKWPFGDGVERHYYEYDGLPDGMGYCLTTYKGDGDPLPPYEGEPFLLPLEGDIVTVAHTLWYNLNEENRVAIAVKFINADSFASEVYILNKYIKV